MSPKFLPLFLAWLTFLPSVATAAESELYYATEAPFREQQNVEIRLSGGLDFSNPYLNIYSGQLGVFLFLDPTLAIGAEGTLFTSSKRTSTETLESELSRHNYQLRALSPNFSAVGVVRVTPISGSVNLFSTAVMMADISLVARVGGISYERPIGGGPLLGTGLEVNLGVTPNVGVHTVMVWDWEKPGAQDWQSRAGFRIGPSVRF